VAPNIDRAEAAIIDAELSGMIIADLLRAKERFIKVKTFRSKKAAKEGSEKVAREKSCEKA
jgi:hypothetical protein